MWQLFINGLEGKTHTVTVKGAHPEQTTVKALKILVKEATGIEPDAQRLIYGGKQLEDDQTLEDYGTIRNHSNITLVVRLHGGGARQSTPRSENQGGNQSISQAETGTETSQSSEDDESVTSQSETEPEDEDLRCMITDEGIEDGTIVFKMPCGHPMCVDGLMEYVWNEVSSGNKTKILCPQCTAEWSLKVIEEYGRVPRMEMEQLELGLNRNFCNESKDINQCPQCTTYCTRVNPDLSNVKCVVCSKKKSTNFYFCWHCLKEWKASATSTKCGNPECDDAEKLSQLRDCGTVKVDFLRIEILKLRACPSCGTVIELIDGCKHLKCTACKTEFCFVCLRQRTQGSWQCGSYDTVCHPAPLQTKIPKRQLES